MKKRVIEFHFIVFDGFNGRIVDQFYHLFYVPPTYILSTDWRFLWRIYLQKSKFEVCSIIYCAG